VGSSISSIKYVLEVVGIQRQVIILHKLLGVVELAVDRVLRSGG